MEDCSSVPELDQEEWVFCNVYAVTREYGGPEEGGWWYDAGEPCECVRVRRKDADAMCEKLEASYADAQPRHNRFSVLGGADIRVVVEDEFAQAYPRETPHYE